MVRKGTKSVKGDALSDGERPFAEDGARLAASRLAAGYRSQREFANALGIRARHTVSRWESGAVEVPLRRRPSIAAKLQKVIQDIWKPNRREETIHALLRLSPKDFGRIIQGHRQRLGLGAAEYAPRVRMRLKRAVEQLEAGISERAQREAAARELWSEITEEEIATITVSSGGGRVREQLSTRGAERVAIDELFSIARALRQLADRADDTGRALLNQMAIPMEH